MFRVSRVWGAVRQGGLISERRWYSVAVWHADPETNVSEVRKSTPPKISAELQREVSALSARIGQSFRNASLLAEAVTHQSADPVSNNKRLAVLGESIAVETLTEHFFVRYPNLPMHSIRSLRSNLISLATISTVGRRIGLHHALNIVFPAGTKAEVSDKAVTDGFHALVAGIYLDQGSVQARKFVRDLLLPEINGVDIADFVRLAHPKVMLAQMLRDAGKQAPSHKLIKESGRLSHLPTFVVEVYSGDTPLAQGASYSIKKAEVEAYRTALRTHFGETYKTAPLPSEPDS